MLDDKNKKLNDNLNSKMRIGTYVHPLFHSIVGDTIKNRGKDIMYTKSYTTTKEELTERFWTTPVYIDGESHNLKLKYKIPYGEHSANHEPTVDDWIDIPISLKDTFYGLSYSANKEYLFKAHACVRFTSSQNDNVLVANEYKFPIFIKDDKVHRNIKNISINNLGLLHFEIFAQAM